MNPSTELLHPLKTTIAAAGCTFSDLHGLSTSVKFRIRQKSRVDCIGTALLSPVDLAIDNPSTFLSASRCGAQHRLQEISAAK